MASGDFEASSSAWTWEEDKRFENALVDFPEGYPDRWGRIAELLGTKSAAEVEEHYGILLDDVAAIEEGLIECPNYGTRSPSEGEGENPKVGRKPIGGQRKAARPWTEEEHKAFLCGLKDYGKGDWKSISRYCVKSRSPAQVASHAQKYYERQEKEEQNKKRRSIFDNSIKNEGS